MSSTALLIQIKLVIIKALSIVSSSKPKSHNHVFVNLIRCLIHLGIDLITRLSKLIAGTLYVQMDRIVMAVRIERNEDNPDD